MKLIYLSNNRMPIALAHGLQVMSMCKAFTEVGAEVDLLVPRRVNPIKESAFSYYGIEKTFPLRKIWCIDFIFLSGKFFWFWLQSMTFLAVSRLYLTFKKYDILFTREQATGLFFSDYILELHLLPKKIKPFHHKMWRKARALVVLTPFIKERLIAVGVPAEKILVSPDGVDTRQFDIPLSKDEAREKVMLPKDKKLIGYVGMLRTLGMEKGVDTAIEALVKVSDASLVLVGGSEQDIAYYKEYAEKREVSDRIIFIGRVHHSLIPVYLKAFDVLIAPFPENEHYSYYMSPMKIFEYMASNRPIVTSLLPSLQEVVGKGEALLVAPGSVNELAEGLQKVLNDNDMAQRLSEKALQSIQEYTWKTRAQKIFDFVVYTNK